MSIIAGFVCISCISRISCFAQFRHESEGSIVSLTPVGWELFRSSSRLKTDGKYALVPKLNLANPPLELEA